MRLTSKRATIESLKANPKIVIQKETIYVKDTVFKF